MFVSFRNLKKKGGIFIFKNLPNSVFDYLSNTDSKMEQYYCSIILSVCDYLSNIELVPQCIDKVDFAIYSNLELWIKYWSILRYRNDPGETIIK